jgi:hypothetical protein
LELYAATLLVKLYKKAIRALNTTINEFYLWTDSSIVLTWIQGPPNKWKASVGHNVDMIQEETSSAIWRHVPTQSNSADLISRGTEPSTLSTSTPCWKGPHRSSQKPSSWLATEFSTPTDTWNSEMYMLHFYNSRRHYTKIFQIQQTYQTLHTAEDPSTTADIPKPTGKQPF